MNTNNMTSHRTPNISIVYTTEYGSLYDMGFSNWQEFVNAFEQFNMIKNAKDFVIIVSHQTNTFHRTFNSTYLGKHNAKDWILNRIKADMDDIAESLSKTLPSPEDKAKAEANA